MGPGRVHRRVLARSAHENLDLIGLDSRSSFVFSRSISTKIRRMFGFNRDLDALVVRTKSAFIEADDVKDARKTHLTFAWRGLASISDLERLEVLFDETAGDMVSAMQSRSVSGLEWQLSQLIHNCRFATERVKDRLIYLRSAFLFIIFLYMMTFIYLFDSSFFKSGGGF